MPDDLIIADEICDYLADEGVVTPAEDGDTTPPPCFTDPREGALALPMPDGADALVVINTGVEIPGEWLEGDFLANRAIEFVVRAQSRAAAELIQRQIRGKMEEKKNLTMGRLLVESSKLWRGTQLIASDADSYTLSQSFLVEVRIASLTV